MEEFINDIALIDKDLINPYKAKKLVKAEINKKDKYIDYKSFKAKHVSEGQYCVQVYQHLICVFNLFGYYVYCRCVHET